MNLTGIVLLVVALHLLVAIHEFGHAVAASALGGQVRSVKLGIGPGFTLRPRSLRFPISVGMVPLVGWVEHEAPKSIGRYARSRSYTILVALAGPGANLLLAFIIGAGLAALGSGSNPVQAGSHVATGPSRMLVSAVAQQFASDEPTAGPQATHDRGPTLGEIFEPAGPVAVASTVPRPSRSTVAWAEILLWVALVSAVLGTMNLLPLPPLDGGVILCEFLPERFSRRLSTVGAVVLMAWTSLVLLADFF